MILVSGIIDWLVRRRVRDMVAQQDGERRFYVITVPRTFGRSRLRDFAHSLNDEYEANFIVIPDNVTIEDVTEEIVNRMTDQGGRDGDSQDCDCDDCGDCDAGDGGAYSSTPLDETAQVAYG